MADVEFSEREDELIALSSIYVKENFQRVVDEPAGIFRVSPRVSENAELTVQFDDKENRTISVNHLPPFILTFHLPEDYPARSPPGYSMSCKWLSREKVCALCAQLDTLWTPECVVLFTWVNFLVEESLEFLGVSTSNPEAYCLKVEVKQKAVSGALSDHCGSQDGACVRLLTAMQQYDEDQRAITFKQNYHDCNVCFSSKLGSDSIQFFPCRHSFCAECATAYFEVQIREGDVKSLRCMDPDCASEARPDQVEGLVSKELYSRYDSLLLQKYLESSEDIVVCPARICQSPVVKDGGSSNMASCPKCRLVFCVLCRRTWHGVSPCDLGNAKRHQIVKQYREGTQEQRDALTKQYGPLVKRYMEESISEEWLDENSKACPTCGCHIQKTEGCNKMTCTRCRNHFCWMCLAKLNRGDPYKHFSDRKTDCYNRLFDGMTEDEFWEDEAFFED